MNARAIIEHEAWKLAVNDMKQSITALNSMALELHPKNDEKLFSRRHLYIIQMGIIQDIINFPHKYLVGDVNRELQEKTKELVNEMMGLPAKPQGIFNKLKNGLGL